MRSIQHSWRRLGGAALAVLAVSAGVITGGGATPAGAVGPPVPLFSLDATNPASYPGTGTTWTDLSGNARHGTLNGAVTYNPTTHAMQFPGGTNGTAWVSLGGAFNDFSSGLTLQFEGEFGATRAPWERIFDFAAGVDDTDDALWVGQHDASNELALELLDNGTRMGYCVTATSGGALGAIGSRAFAKWVVTLGDKNGTNTCRIYKDGVELQTEILAPGTPNGPNPNGSPYPAPPIATRTSAFVGRSNWSADNDLEGSIRSIRVYNTVLTPAEVTETSTATITFHANGGTGSMADQSSTTAVALSANAFTRTNHVFIGWNTAANGTGTSYANTAQHPFTSTATLYAQWVEITDAGYVALNPFRLYDARQDTMLVGGAPARELTVAGVGDIPADAHAVVLNVTATRARAGGYLTVYPCGQARPETSNVNFGAGVDVANHVTVKVGDDGKICLYSPVDTDVVVDVNGAYRRAYGTDAITPITPARLFDSRDTAAKLQPSTPLELTVSGQSAIPGDASAVVLNVTVTDPDTAGYVTAYPCGGPPPWVSSVNFGAGQTVPNLVAVRVGNGGKVCFSTTTPTHLVIDASASMSPNGGTRFLALTPQRIVDSRLTGRFAAGVTEVPVAGHGGVSAQASAVAVNVTVTDPAAAGYVTVYPCGTAAPLASNLNFGAGQTVANAVVVGLAGDKLCVLATSPTDLVIDVNGQFTPVS